MSCLGVLFSLSEQEVMKIKNLKTNEERRDFITNDIEEKYFDDFPERLAELDKSWDGLHRSLTDGKCDWNNGTYPLNHVILGGEMLYDEDDYIMVLKTPKQVREIAKAIQTLSKDDLRKGYNQIPVDDEEYAEFLSEEDFDYTWDWFEPTKKFWQLAAEEERYVLFTADQ